MAINELVEKIIEKRKGKLPILREKMMMIENLSAALDMFDDFKSEIVDPQGNPIVGGKYDSIIAKNPEMVYNLNTISTEYCKNRIVQAKATLEEAIKRFSRDSINVSVVGHARIGKSRFLQSVSNLPNTVIPAFDDTDCTGAVSVIQNVPGTELKAEITFKTESEMVEIVQTYLDRIIPDPDKRMVVRTLNNIRDLDLKEVGRRMVDGNADNNLEPYLRKFVEHFEEWAACIREKETVLYDDKIIATYVAQNNGIPTGEDGRKEYYKYLAVKSCVISCTFDYQDAGKITLIDTIGFGDNAVGIEDELVGVINDKSDAAIFMLYPLLLAGGGITKEITAVYDRISKNCNNKNLDKWLFWLINHAPKHPKTPNTIDSCNITLSTLENNRWHGAMRKIIDVSNQEQVREEFLIPLLNNLIDNLDEIDSLYLQDVQAALENVKKEYLALCRSAKKVMQSELKDAVAMQPYIGEMTKNHRRAIASQIFEHSLEVKQSREIPCKALKKVVDEIIEGMEDSTLIPSKETMLRDWSAEGGQISTIFNNYCNDLRNALTKKFSDVDVSLRELVAGLKNDVALKLISDDTGKLGRIIQMDTNKPAYEWIKDFCDNVLDEKTYPNLYYAFKSLYEFDFSVKGFLTYEVRVCMDALDSSIVSVDIRPTGDKYEDVDLLEFMLERKLIDVSDLLKKQLDTLMIKPNRAFFAAVKEFSDQIHFAKGVDMEWERLLSENFTVLWHEECEQMRRNADTFAEWQAVLEKLLEYSSSVNMFAIE